MTEVKICGLYRDCDIDYVNQVKPDYAGFVLDFPKSHRSITLLQAKELLKSLDSSIKTVCVLVDKPLDYAITCGQIFDIIQLHGNEDNHYIQALRKNLTDTAIWQAFKIKKTEDLNCARISHADQILLDNGYGTGKSFDWSHLGGFDLPFILAGGLQQSNIIDAIHTYQPICLDISSGVETNQQKDFNKINTVVSTIRSYHKKEDSMSNTKFGIHGGQYIPETLMNAVLELETAYNHYKNDPKFIEELSTLFREYTGRPSGLYYAKKMTKDLGGAKIYLKREDLNHTGSHKVNNVLGQVLLAHKMGKTRVIAETGAGQHGVATATAAALFGMECEIFMGKEDTERQALNVYKMKLLGATVHEVTAGTATLKDAVSETMREWTKRIHDTHYVLGSVMGPHPFPTIVRDFQAVISKEIKEQCLEKEGKLPDVVLACVGGGSNAIGAFYHFIEDETVSLIGCEAAGKGIDTLDTAATISVGKLGIFHGMKSYFCQDEYGQIAPVYSISAGLDYPGIGPEHAHLYDTKRAEYVPITDEEAVDAFEYLSRTEGIIPAIESSHAIAHAVKIAPLMKSDEVIVINLSGRGDKDCAAIARYRGEEISE